MTSSSTASRSASVTVQASVPPSRPAPALPAATEPLVEIILVLREGNEAEALQQARDALGERAIVRSEESADGALPMEQVPPDGIRVFSRLGVALTWAEPAQVGKLQAMAAAGSALEEMVLAESFTALGAFNMPGPAPRPAGTRPLTYLAGYRDAVNHLAQAFGVGPTSEVRIAQEGAAATEYRDDARGTWGLHATGVLNSRYTGRGVPVAALVDGLDRAHPDWVARHAVMKSFVAGEPPSAGGASGTHYLGTARPSAGVLYGCAPDAVPFVAKVLNRMGSGSRTAILAGVDWAVANQCRIILVPLGWGGPLFDNVFELVARRVASRGGLLIAGAGNNARRNAGEYGFVINPAACPSVMGVGAIDARLTLPDWTPRSSAASGGTIDLVAPGVNLRSSVPRPLLYASWSGSATAAAYVAGIAALWAEALPNAKGHELWHALVSHARLLPLPTSDIGAGVVQAP